MTPDDLPALVQRLTEAKSLIYQPFSQEIEAAAEAVIDTAAAALTRLARERDEKDAEGQEFRKAVAVAGKLFQPGGKYHDRAMPDLWGKSTVIDGMKWLDKRLTAAEAALTEAQRERDEARALAERYVVMLANERASHAAAEAQATAAREALLRVQVGIVAALESTRVYEERILDEAQHARKSRSNPAGGIGSTKPKRPVS
ncbi:MAG: hypothetical protein ACYC2H_01425 [Thermoplasmatota archaeon]